MTNKKQVRFKTEAEFIKEFGKDWTTKVERGWVSAMNELFGQPSNHKHASYWNISKDMLTTRRLPKELPDGTIIKVGMKLWWTPVKNTPVIVTKIYGDWDTKTVQVNCTCDSCKGLQDFLPDISELTKA
jgi:hypothetical protein